MTNHRPYSHTFDHLTDLQVAQYVEALLTGQPSAIDSEIRHHVEECLKCKSEVLGLYSLRYNSQTKSQEISIDAAYDTSGFLKNFQRKSWLKMAALFVIVIGISAVSYYISVPGISQHKQSQSAAGDTAVTITNYASLSRFDESPNLEDLLHSSMRSSTIKVLSPPDGFNAKNQIEFRWENGNSATYYLKILNNREEIVQQDTLQGTQFLLKKLPVPGLYYWKLENQTELLHLGKFIIRR